MLPVASRALVEWKVLVLVVRACLTCFSAARSTVLSISVAYEVELSRWSNGGARVDAPLASMVYGTAGYHRREGGEVRKVTRSVWGWGQHATQREVLGGACRMEQHHHIMDGGGADGLAVGGEAPKV